MRFAGTISIPEDVFADILEFSARSFKQHGFLDIAFLGDSGGNQAAQKIIAEKLNEEWTETKVRVHHVSDFYPGRGDDWVINQNISAEDVGGHAGTHDTSSLLYLNPSMLRLDQMKLGRPGDGQGHTGNPAVSTPEFGERILKMQIEDAVDQITKERLAIRQ
jgi:creatinine amidohydrolase/Fe(II)-dependent formamide hydrolase-like protein